DAQVRGRGLAHGLQRRRPAEDRRRRGCRGRGRPPVTGSPFKVVDSRELCHHLRYELRTDEVEWPDGTRGTYAVLRQPEAALIVPVTETLTTFLVRQWRHSWQTDGWEGPAGTVEEGEDPLLTAHRELVEEAGLEASD